MRLSLSRLAVRLAAILALLAGSAVTLAAAVPASAALQAAQGIGPDWTQQTLPTGYSLGVPLPGNPMSPVSCVPGTTFCAVIVNDTATTPPPDQFLDVQAVFVTTDGSHWTTGGDLPAGYQYASISCPTTTVCYVAGAPDGSDSPNVGSVEVSVDGAQTWNPVSGATANQLTSIDCVSTQDCYLTSGRGGGVAGVYFTANGGTTWHPGWTDSTDTYGIYDVSCLPDGSLCVAVGGSNNANNGQGLILVGTASAFPGQGASWAAVSEPVLSELSVLFGADCVPVSGSAPTCYVVGASDNISGQSAPVQLASVDGGQSWAAYGYLDYSNGWLNSISCADATDCWAGGAGDELSLTGTTDGSDWFPVNTTDRNQLNYVSCASVDFCVATADNALWVTTDDGGIVGQPVPDPSISEPLPPITPPSVIAPAGQSQTVNGQDRKYNAGTAVQVTTRLPDGHVVKSTGSIDKLFFYSLKVPSLPIGASHVRFTISGQQIDYVVLHGSPIAHAAKARITSAHRVTFTIGRKSRFKVTTTGTPRPTLWKTGTVPRGITFNQATGVLSGTPAKGTAGSHAITFTATNGDGPDWVQHLVLVIAQPTPKPPTKKPPTKN